MVPLSAGGPSEASPRTHACPRTLLWAPRALNISPPWRPSGDLSPQPLLWVSLSSSAPQLLHTLHQLIRHVVSCRGSPLLQNGVVWVCAERAAIPRRPVRLRPELLPGAGGRVFPEPALLSGGPRSPRWAAASSPTAADDDAFVSAAASGFSPCWKCRQAASMFVGFHLLSCEPALAPNRCPPLPCLCEGSAPRRGGSAADSRPSAAGAKAMLASCAACFTCSSTHTITRPLGVPFVI